MCEMAVRDDEDQEITDLDHVEQNEFMRAQDEPVRPPLSVVLATVLYCAEFIIASVVSYMYSKTSDVTWMGFTIAFMLLPALLIQLTLTFIHRDLGRDRPLVLFMHLLQLGPVIRCCEALIVYFRADKENEPYVTLVKQFSLKKKEPIEKHVGQAARSLATHRNAFKRTAIIQAFLGSTPQLTLQLYATIQEKHILPTRLTLMIITLISITYGALVCNVLAIKIRYDDYLVRLRPVAYLCIIIWRGLEIATRVTSLVLFSTAPELSRWVILVGMANLLFFFFLPWVEFWIKKGSLAEGVEKNFSKLGTTIVLCMFTLLYACINVFCWSAVQLDLTHKDLIEKKQMWGRLALYYSGRFIENALLVILWYLYKSDFYEYVCTPLLTIQLLICYSLSVVFMLLFYQFFHPCKQLFKYNVHDCLHCVCCCRGRSRRQVTMASSYSTAATMVLMPVEPSELSNLQNLDNPDLSRHWGERETDILDNIVERV